MWLLVVLGLVVRAAGAEPVVTLSIPSIHCEMCEATVERALEKVPGVRAVRVDIEGKTAAVTLGAPASEAMPGVLAALAARDKPATVVREEEFDGVRGVAASRLARLARGVNLSHWLWLPRGADAEAFIGPADMALLRGAGMTHVRLPVEPDVLWDASAHALRPRGVASLRRAIGLALEADLAVVVDPHPNASAWVEFGPGGEAGEFTAFWRDLAKELSGTDAERVFLEVMNEPHGLKPGAWAAAQRGLIAAIRAGAPRHTIIATGDDWSNIAGLQGLEIGVTPNLVVTFHFYEPHTFTHQGATWGWPGWRHVRGLTYPADRERAGELAGAITDDAARDAVRQYAKEGWNDRVIASRVKVASEWARTRGVALYCGEFGAYREGCDAASRERWLRDVTAALGAERIGWAMWDYAGGFALTRGVPGARALDGATARALGLADGK